MTIPVLLTATVNPQGMKGANFDPAERLDMYVEALEFYAKKGMDVVFAENSGCINMVAERVKAGNVELVDVSGSEYDQTRGKGYNETILIHKAVVKSEMIRQAGCFFKITGRLKLLNVEKLIAECTGGSQVFRADCKDHRLYEWLHMPINGHAGECRYWFASIGFFESMMWPRYSELNDYEPNICLAEDLMLDVCRKSRGMTGCRDRFSTQARISGKGGHSLGRGWSFFYSTDNDSFALRSKCFIRQMLRWLMPWWKV